MCVCACVSVSNYGREKGCSGISTGLLWLGNEKGKKYVARHGKQREHAKEMGNHTDALFFLGFFVRLYEAMWCDERCLFFVCLFG